MNYPTFTKEAYASGIEDYEEYACELVKAEHMNDVDLPDCPWPIYTVEGASWLSGWNSVAEKEDKRYRTNQPI